MNLSTLNEIRLLKSAKQSIGKQSSGCNRIYIEHNAFQLFDLQNLYLYERKGLDGRRNCHKLFILGMGWEHRRPKIRKGTSITYNI